MDSLSQYEAVKLFIDRARAAVPTFSVTNENAPAVAQICYRLDGIPLAIELAAAKVRALRVDQIAKRLDNRFRLLTGGSRTALERHQTLRAAIDWSYYLLPPAEQALFRRLAVFVGGWTLEAAEFVCQGESVQNNGVMHIQEQLINKSLVSMDETQAEPRYTMLETIRQYANEKLVEAGESDALRDRHLEYFLKLAETAEPYLIHSEQLEWLAKLDADYENIRLALEWALNKESAEPSLRLCAALGWFWTVRGYWMEGTRWLKNALSKPDPFSEKRDVYRVRALSQDAALANWLDDLGRMKSSAEQSLALAQEVSEKRDIAISRFYLGWALDRQGDYHRAISLMEQSLHDFQGMNDIYWESISYRWLAMRFFAQGKITEEERVNHHLELARKAGEKKNLGEALLARAYFLFRHSRLSEAIENAEEAKVLFKQLGLKDTEAGHFFEMVAWLRGDYEGARSILMEMNEGFKDLGDRNLRSLALADLGMLALEEEKANDAHVYLMEALAIARELSNEDAILERMADLGNVFYLQGNIPEFRKMYIESFELAKQIGTLTKRSPLVSILYSLYNQIPETTAQILGALYSSEQETGRPIHPLWKRYYDRAEVYARRVLGNTFDSLFVEGQKLSLDQAIDLLLKTIKEM